MENVRKIEFSEPGELAAVEPMSDEEKRALRKYFAICLDAQHVGCMQRELSEDRADLMLRQQQLRQEMGRRQADMRQMSQGYPELDRVKYERRLAAIEVRLSMINEVLSNITPRADGLRSQRDAIEKALGSVGMLHRLEIACT